ncbi:MAG: threonine--tRNA ligase, partial [Actinomycetota bacterium]
YWRGDVTRPMLQRIYGTAWDSKKALKTHLQMLAEAEKRDHRRLAAELDLVSWPDELGPGLAVWHPKGALIRKIMEDYSRDRHENGGYEFVFSPHIAKSVLWETSGHLDFYADGMYPPMEMDNGTYYPKPMNCPMHVLVYRSSQRSYRDLPVRLFELGTVYRYERAGTLHGLMRIRGFTQDDAHLFVTQEGLADELATTLDFILSMLNAFGFEDFSARLSTRPEEKSVGSDELWELATEALRTTLDNSGLDYEVDEGDGAFYGPKIDIDVRDAIGRSWQLSTLQADFQLPDRFGLEYVAPDGSRKQPVMLHRALMGSIERFFGVLLEHFAGNFPLWLAPVQVEVLPVAEAHQEYAAALVERLTEAGFRVELNEATDPLGKRIRRAKTQKLPYVLVVGDDDVAAGTAGVNPRGGDVERDVTIDAFIERLQAEAQV